MATKDELPDKYLFDICGDSNDTQYNNLNLNQKFTISSSYAFSEHSKSTSAEKRKPLNYGTAAPTILLDFTNTKRDCHSLNKATTKFPLNFGKGYCTVEEERWKKGKDKDTSNSSTLSLHIIAFEKMVEKGKRLFADSMSVIQNSFEFPRQQENDEIKASEVSQFKASQHLLNLNLLQQNFNKPSNMSQTDNNKIVTRSKARQGGGSDRIEPHHKPKNREPNGTASQMHSKERKEVRLGPEAQVPLTDVENSYIGPDGWETYSIDLDVMVWNGGKGLDDEEVYQYLKHAAHNHKIPGDKALYILHSCNNDIAKAKLELFAHINLEDQWTTDDDRVFWYAFHAFGKNFAKIKQLLPHKKMLSIVNHYYATKKHQNYRSVLNDEMGKNATFELSDDEETEPLKRALFYICKNCGASVKRTYYVNLLEVCKACKLYFKVANEHRPVNRPRQFDKRVKCPPEMLEIALKFEKMGQESSRTYDDDEDIVCVDRPARTVCDNLIQEAHKEIESKKAKAHILSSKNLAIDYNEMCDIKKATETLEKISNEKSASRQRNSHMWSDFEQAAAYHCLVRFNLDYEAVAEVIGNKSTEMVKAFALENLEQIEKAIEKQRGYEPEINVEEERPKPPPAEIIDIDD